MAFRLKLLGIGLGVVAVVWGVKERKLAAGTGDAPQKLTCRALGERGPGDNANVILTDFLVAPSFVYESGKSGRWTRVWTPVTPLDGEYAQRVKAAFESGGASALAKLPPPKPVSVIVTSSAIADEKALDALGDKDTLEGLVINSIESMDGEEKKLLEKTYGDVSKAWIFEVGRKPTNAMLAFLAIGVGAAGALYVLSTFFRRKT